MALLVRAFHIECPVAPAGRSSRGEIPDTIGRFTLLPRPSDSKQVIYHRALTIPAQGRFTLALPSLSGAVCDDVEYSMEACPSIRVGVETAALVFDSDLNQGHDVDVTVSFTMADEPPRTAVEHPFLRPVK